jgi:hypothetical protein
VNGKLAALTVGIFGAIGAGSFFLLRKNDAPLTAVPGAAPSGGSISNGTAKPVDVISTGSGYFDNLVSNVTKALEPRGIRNNNPGNLVLTTIAWKGKVPNAQNTDGKFEQFTQPLWGIRAMFMDVRGDIEKDGLNTIRKLITVYAPAFENNTAAYIQSVVNQVGIGADTKIQSANYLNLLKAIINHENGKQPYSDALIIEAMNTP